MTLVITAVSFWRPAVFGGPAMQLTRYPSVRRSPPMAAARASRAGAREDSSPQVAISCVF